MRKFRQKEDLVFLDETGVNLAMVSLYVGAAKGLRAYSKRTLKKRKNISIIDAMTFKKGFLTGLSFNGKTNGDTFLWFIKEVLVLQLWSGAVVVMDNLPAHMRSGIL